MEEIHFKPFNPLNAKIMSSLFNKLNGFTRF